MSYKMKFIFLYTILATISCTNYKDGFFVNSNIYEEEDARGKTYVDIMFNSELDSDKPDVAKVYWNGKEIFSSPLSFTPHSPFQLAISPKVGFHVIKATCRYRGGKIMTKEYKLYIFEGQPVYMWFTRWSESIELQVSNSPFGIN